VERIDGSPGGGDNRQASGGGDKRSLGAAGKRGVPASDLENTGGVAKGLIEWRYQQR